jgi:hypothetical protein
MSLLRSIADYVSKFNIPISLYYVMVFAFLPFQLMQDLWCIFFVHPNLKSPPNTIYVSGVLGFGNSIPGPVSYWGVLDSKTTITPDTGPLSSGYDLAVELFYNLKGVQTVNNDIPTRFMSTWLGKILIKIRNGILNFFVANYNKTSAPINAHAHLHSPLQVNKVGMVPQWSEEYPLTFVGHSKGCGAILRLMYMLDNDGFPGHKTSSKWIKSMVLISPVLPQLNYAELAGWDSANATVKYYSKMYYLFSIAYNLSTIFPVIIRNLWDVDIKRFNFNGNGLDNFLHDNALVSPELIGITETFQQIKDIIKKNNIPSLYVISNSNQPVTYNNKVYYLVKPVCNVFIYLFQYFGDSWDGDKQDGVVSRSTELNIIQDVNDKANILDTNLDHLDIIGTFRKDNAVIDIWNRILIWIKNHQ